MWLADFNRMEKLKLTGLDLSFPVSLQYEEVTGGDL